MKSPPPLLRILLFFFISSSNSFSTFKAVSFHKTKPAFENILNHEIRISDATRLNAVSNVGVVGTGFISALTSKLASLAGYKAWMLHPTGEDEKIRRLLYHEEIDDNEEYVRLMNAQLSLVEASDTDLFESKIKEMEVLVIATDNPDNPMDVSVVSYLLENAPELKQIILMSRTLNLKDMGFFVKASKTTANGEVWYPENELIKKYKALEDIVQEFVKEKEDVTYSILRTGTLKGGGLGDVEESPFLQYLTQHFYEVTKKDIVTWNLLFDCRTRGVQFYEGDIMPGPGAKAIFTATSYEECAGDTSRSSAAECLVRMIDNDNLKNGADFCIGTKEGREIPTDEEWKALFAQVS